MGDRNSYGCEKVSGIPRWAFDALRLEIAFMEHLDIERPEWTDEDADTLETYAHACMQATSQMSGGEGHERRNEYGDLVAFEDTSQILVQIAVLAVRMVLAGAHRGGVMTNE